MACEKYSGWMTAASLGGLPAADQAELRAHTAGCARCREEWEVTASLVAAVDRSVQSLVEGEPSPQFAARLRARIAEEPAPSAWPTLPWPRFAAAALVAAAVLIIALSIRAPHQPATEVQPAANAQPRAEQQPVVTERTAPGQPIAATRVAGNHGRGDARVRHREPSFEVLVPKGQLSAALLLSEGLNEGAIDGAQLVQLSAHSAQPLEVKELAIAPLALPAAPEESASPAGGDGRLR